ncbi:MAG: hypothetical protein SF028_11605 [Candidatus Sumerlaeia bacterium]|nr:hypothetical protein [Candidatus Sumerlaeia bacterium]
MDSLRRTAAALAACAAITASAHAAPFQAWLPGDVSPLPEDRYTLEAGRFLSPALAGGVARSLESMGWRPVLVWEDGPEHVVSVGDIETPAEAAALAAEFRSQRIVEGRVAKLPRSARAIPAPGVDGPFLPSFAISPRPGRAPLRDEELRPVLEDGKISSLGERQALFDEALAALDAGNLRATALGDAAVLAANPLVGSVEARDRQLAMLERVASGRWGASPAVRRAAAEACADIYLGDRGDVGAAWRATRALLADPEADAASAAMDLLRREAISATLLTTAGAPPPSFAAMRSRLRAAYDRAPEEAVEVRARIALFYLRTFAWEGRWDRVREVGEEYLTRFPSEPGETQAAALLLARSYEAYEQYDGALVVLDKYAGSYVQPEARLRSGTRTVDPMASAREWREYLLNLSVGVEPARRPAEAVLTEDRQPLAIAVPVPKRAPGVPAAAPTPAPVAAESTGTPAGAAAP